MAGLRTGANSIPSKDSNPLRLSPRSIPLQKRPARLPPIEKAERKKLPGYKSHRPPAPPPSPAPWSWYHRDCLHSRTNVASRDVESVLSENELPATRVRFVVGQQPIPSFRREEPNAPHTASESPSPSLLWVQRPACMCCKLPPSSPSSESTSPSPPMVEFQKVGKAYVHNLVSQQAIGRASCHLPPEQNELALCKIFDVNWASQQDYGRASCHLPPRKNELALSRIFDVSRLLQDGQLSSFLLQVAQAVFEEMVSLDTLIKRILEFAQRLVNADRASLFLVDNVSNELVSTVFDLKYEPDQDNDLQKKEIRMPLNKGIAGYVASHGVAITIPDAYADRRFNKAVDDATGYRTSTILCMPIKVQGQVIAVVQMVNKRDKKVFNSEDESAFKIFSTLFGLALHHARLYDQIMRNEQKYKIALEVLSYHNACDEEDVDSLLRERRMTKKETMNYDDFMLNPFELSELEKCKGFLAMFDDLFDIKQFDVTVLARFVLTVKKNYRKVPYHNFDHGWSVANAAYVILKRDTRNRFDYKSKLALFVACLCHDLDHRGYTNRYMLDIGSPLAAMYSTSTLEHHHFNITVTILQQEGHNIFSRLSSEDYKEVLDLIRQSILATDLAAFFPNLMKINELIFVKRSFNWNDESHRALCRGILMTSADLSAAAKPFPVQLQTAAIIQAEFFHQGDLEKQAGREPIAMMDRDKPDEQPNNQVNFISEICLPAYKVLHHLFPVTRIMYATAVDNLDKWRIRARVIQESKGKPSLESKRKDEELGKWKCVIIAQQRFQNVLRKNSNNRTSLSRRC